MIKKVEIQKFLVTESESDGKVIQQIFTLGEPPVLLVTIDATPKDETKNEENS